MHYSEPPRERKAWSLQDLRTTPTETQQRLSELIHEFVIQIYAAVPNIPAWMLAQCLTAEAAWLENPKRKNKAKTLQDLHISSEEVTSKEFLELAPIKRIVSFSPFANDCEQTQTIASKK